MLAVGSFEVSLQPLEPFFAGCEGNRLGRMSITKKFSGDLTAQSLGEMFSAMTTTPDSAGYVAIEQVEGTLNGRAGTFVLQHYGISSPGQQRLILEVVPDSGTGELRNLAGRMAINIKAGSHLYELDYSLPD